jgi:hypothetical protein
MISRLSHDEESVKENIDEYSSVMQSTIRNKDLEEDKTEWNASHRQQTEEDEDILVIQTIQ